MKNLILVIACVVIPSASFALRIINDSPMQITIHTYNTADNIYAIARDIYVVEAGRSFDLPIPGSEGRKIQVWSSRNKQLSTNRLKPGRIFYNNDYIVIDGNHNVTVNQEGTLPLYPVPNKRPDPITYGNRILEGQGFSKNLESITSDGGTKLILENGKLLVKNPNGQTCITFPEENVQFVILLSGFLILYSENPAGGYTILGTYGNFRPTAEITLPFSCTLHIGKNGQYDWRASDSLMPVRKGG